MVLLLWRDLVLGYENETVNCQIFHRCMSIYYIKMDVVATFVLYDSTVL